MAAESSKASCCQVTVIEDNMEDNMDITGNRASGTGSDLTGAESRSNLNGGQSSGSGPDYHAASAISQDPDPNKVSRSMIMDVRISVAKVSCCAIRRPDGDQLLPCCCTLPV